MRPTRAHYFFAEGWPIKAGFYAFSFGVVCVAVLECQPSLSALKDGGYLFWLACVAAVGFVLGRYAAIPLIWLLLGPVYHWRGGLNGAPFKVGDEVEILVGKNRGRVVKVYSQWQHDQFRVELGPEAEDKYQDVFSPFEVIRVRDRAKTPH